MKKTSVVAASAILFALAMPAAAADYYLASHYVTTTGDGEAVLLVNGDTVRTNEEGRKVADIAAINSGGVVLSIYTSEFDCAAASWRTRVQTDYYVDGNMAPYTKAPRELPAFTAVNDGTPIKEAMTLVCGWPAGKAAARKTTASDPVVLNKMISPGLKYIQPANGGR